MATAAASNFQALYHSPGNPQLPTLPAPGDPKDGFLPGPITIAGVTGGAREPEVVLEVHAAGPNLARGFAQTYLNRVGATPVPMDFGSITAEKNRTITFHNTNRTSVTLNSIDLSNIPELSTVSPGLPAVIPPFSSLVVTISAPQEGVSEFDTTIDFVFISQTITVRVLGVRTLLFPIHPDAGITEQLKMKTGLLRSKDATEQAMGLRVTPRRTISVSMSLDSDEERTRLESIVLGGVPSLLFSVPQFQEARNLSAAALAADTTIFLDTTTATFADDGKVHLRLPDGSTLNADIVTVETDRLNLNQSIGVDLPQRTFCMPSYNGRMTRKPRLGISAVNLEVMSLDFTFWDTPEIGGVSPPASLTTAHPVDGLTILTAPNAVAGRTKTGSLDREDEEVDNQTGPIFVSGSEPIGEFGSQFLATARSMAEVYAWRQLHHYLLGSWRKFYIPSYQNDLPASGSLLANSAFIDVPNMGITKFLNGRAPRRDLRFEHPEGVDFTRITSVVDNGATERLNINPVLSNSLTVDPDDLRVSWLNLCRIQGDVMTFRHQYLGRAAVSFRYRSTTE